MPESPNDVDLNQELFGTIAKLGPELPTVFKRCVSSSSVV